MRGRSRIVFLAVAAAVFLGVGVTWTARNLTDVPHYGDTTEYLRLAIRLEVDLYRGIVYPALLAGVDELVGGDPIRTRKVIWEDSGPCAVSSALAVVQVLQVLVLLPALAYFLRTVGNLGFLRERLGRRGGRIAFWMLVALLLFDPLLSHFNLSIMTDSLALAACLAFCAALADLWLGRSPAWIAGTVLVVSHLLAAGLRSEKNVVLLATALATLAAAAWWGRGRRFGAPPAGLRRLVVAVLLSGVCFATTQVVQQRFYGNYGRWPIRTSILHQRIGFPHMEAIYDDLPPHLKALISPAQAHRYDMRVGNTRKVVDLVTEYDPERREQLTRELMPIFLRERWWWIAFDTARDAVENVFATVSFYGRLAVLAASDTETFFELFDADGSRWTWTRLAGHHPRLSRVFVAMGGGVFVLATLLAFAGWRRGAHRDSGGELDEPTRAWLAAGLPTLAFVLINACVFASVANLVHIRYTILAHAAILVLAYRGALLWALPQPNRKSLSADQAA